MSKIISLVGYSIVHETEDSVAIANGTLEPGSIANGRQVKEKWTYLDRGEFGLLDGVIVVPEDVLKAKDIQLEYQPVPFKSRRRTSAM